MQLKLASDPSMVAEISQALAKLDISDVSVEPATSHRDFAVLDVLITAALSSAVKLAIDQIVLAIKAALAKRQPVAKLVVSVGGQSIELRTPEEVEKLRAALNAA